MKATTGRSCNALTIEGSVCRNSESVSSCGLKNMTPSVGVKIRASYHSPPGGSAPSIFLGGSSGAGAGADLGCGTGAGAGSGAGAAAADVSTTGASKPILDHISSFSAGIMACCCCTGCGGGTGAAGAGADPPNIPNGSSDCTLLTTNAPGATCCVGGAAGGAVKEEPHGSSTGAGGAATGTGTGGKDVAEAPKISNSLLP